MYCALHLLFDNFRLDTNRMLLEQKYLRNSLNFLTIKFVVKSAAATVLAGTGRTRLGTFGYAGTDLNFKPKITLVRYMYVCVCTCGYKIMFLMGKLRGIITNLVFICIRGLTTLF